MDVVRHDDVGEFAPLVRPLLDADPTRHTMMLTVLDGLVRDGLPARHLLTLHDGREIVGGALQVEGWPVLLSAVPVAAMAGVDGALADADVTRAVGPVPEAEAYAAARTARTGCSVEVRLRMRLFALGDLRPPTDVRGAARRASADDVALLGAWRQAFGREQFGEDPERAEAAEAVTRALAGGGGETVWEVDGVPVSYASARPVVAAMSRIGPVYTPPEDRRHGYAAAVTAAASRWALDAGASNVVLLTDLANPTTNGLYPRIGYRPVHDAVELAFQPQNRP